MLKKRPEKRLSATRAETIIKAGKLGRGADGMRLFDAMCTVRLFPPLPDLEISYRTTEL
jgi:hypothetical protein